MNEMISDFEERRDEIPLSGSGFIVQEKKLPDMNNFTLKILIRSLINNKLLNAIQIGGLVIGFTIVIFLLVKIKYEYSYDTFWKDSQSIYRLGSRFII